MRPVIFYLAAFALCLLSLCDQPVHSSGGRQNGYILEFDTHEWGAQTMSVCPSGFALELNKWGVRFVASGPQWDLVAYSRAQKAFCDLGPPDSPGEFQLRRFRGLDKVAVEGSIKGLRVLRYKVKTVTRSTDSGNWLNLFTAGEPGHPGKRTVPQVGHEFCVATSLKLNQDVYDANSRIHSFPSLKGLLVDEHDLLADGTRTDEVVLKTWRSAPVDRSVFVAPSGYKRVESITELFGSQISKQFDDFADGFDIGRPLGSNKKGKQK